MNWKLLSLKLGLGVTAVLATGLVTGQAETVVMKKRPVTVVARNSAASPNYSYQSGPHTRIYVSKRSWLDAGTEVLPGDRKFTDYATGGPNSFENLDRLNSHMDFRRQPLNTPADVGGTPTGFPLPY